MDFKAIWDRILQNEGEEFKTVTGLPFTYKIINGEVVPNRTNFPLGKVNFEKAAELMPLKSVGQISNIVYGSSYVYSILTDVRIRMEFEAIWNRILQNEGKEFKTKTELPFTYKIVNGAVVPNRTKFPLAKANFEKAAELMPLLGPGQINNTVYGPSYVYAILTDIRIK